MGPKPLPMQQTRIELDAAGHDEPLDVQLNGVRCTSTTGLPQTYDVPPDAASDGYNLVEVHADQDVKVDGVAISVQ